MIDPATPGEIRRLEAVGRDAWPAEHVARHEGWRLHLCEGGTRRARAVYPEADGAGPLDLRIDHCRRFYAERGLRCVFKLTPASLPTRLDERLGELGWARSDETCVQTASLAEGLVATRDPRVHVADRLDAKWLEQCVRLRGDERRDARAHAGLVERLAALAAPTGFARIEADGRIAAIGLGVLVEGHLFVADVATDPLRRGQGLARAVVQGLLAWGADRGAATGLLQVVADNAPALRLYAGLGFQTRYRYWYRAAPAEDAD